MLFREDILRIIKDMKLPSDEYWIASGAGLVIHGVKESTSDIDLGCTARMFEQFLKEGYTYRVTANNLRIMEISNTVEILENWYADSVEYIDGLPVASLESIRKQKINLGREKDIKDIQLIDGYIKSRR